MSRCLHVHADNSIIIHKQYNLKYLPEILAQWFLTFHESEIFTTETNEKNNNKKQGKKPLESSVCLHKTWPYDILVYYIYVYNIYYIYVYNIYYIGGILLYLYII